MKGRWSGLAVISIAVCCWSCAGGTLSSPRPDPRVVSLGEVADSVAIVRDLGAIDPLGDGNWTGWVSSTVRTDTASVQVLESTMSQFATERIQRAVLANLNPQKRGPEPHTVRVRIQGGAVTLITTRSVGTGPTLLNRRYITERLVHVAQEHHVNATAKVGMRVTRDGRVIAVRILGSTGNPEVDKDLEEVLQSARFKPGLIDGFPATFWISMPFVLTGR